MLHREQVLQDLAARQTDGQTTNPADGQHRVDCGVSRTTGWSAEAHIHCTVHRSPICFGMQALRPTDRTVKANSLQAEDGRHDQRHHAQQLVHCLQCMAAAICTRGRQDGRHTFTEHAHTMNSTVRPHSGCLAAWP